MLNRLDDTALMLRYRDDGDMAAFEMLYSRHRTPLYRYLLRQCGDAQAAEDLFQEAWLRIIRSRETYRPTARFNTYLYRLAHNCLVDRYRQAGRRPVEADCDHEDAAGETAGERPVEDETERLQTAARLRVALDALSREQREAFLLHQETGLTLDEIAAVVGVGRETIKSRLRYAVNHLRARLAGHMTELTGAAS